MRWRATYKSTIVARNDHRLCDAAQSLAHREMRWPFAGLVLLQIVLVGTGRLGRQVHRIATLHRDQDRMLVLDPRIVFGWPRRGVVYLVAQLRTPEPENQESDKNSLYFYILTLKTSASCWRKYSSCSLPSCRAACTYKDLVQR